MGWWAINLQLDWWMYPVSWFLWHSQALPILLDIHLPTRSWSKIILPSSSTNLRPGLGTPFTTLTSSTYHLYNLKLNPISSILILKMKKLKTIISPLWAQWHPLMSAYWFTCQMSNHASSYWNRTTPVASVNPKAEWNYSPILTTIITFLWSELCNFVN